MRKKLILFILIFLTATLTFKLPSIQAVEPVKTTLTGPQTQTSIPFNNDPGNIYHIKSDPILGNGDLTISVNNTGSYTGVVFVEGKLDITGNYCYGSTCPSGTVAPNIGAVFVVKGSVNIAPSVTRVDAVIIAEGKIYTAGALCSLATSSGNDNQLVINGSLISLNDANEIVFCRNLADDSQPAEKIIHQSKYLVILRDLLSDTLQKWSEVP